MAGEINTGYIALHRSIRLHWIWSDPDKLKWWIDILMECNHSNKKVNLGMEIIECRRGQSLNSLDTWAKRWAVDKNKVRRFFKLLADDGMIVTEDVRKTTRLTVCKYDDYNSLRHANDTQATRERHASDTQATPNKNDNNVKNDNNGYIDGDQSPLPVKEEKKDSNLGFAADLENLEKKPKGRKGRIKKPEIRFEDSPVFDKTRLAMALMGTQYEDADLDYYHETVLNWATSKGITRVDWLATIRTFMNGDKREGKYKLKNAEDGNNTTTIQPDASNSRGKGNTLFHSMLKEELSRVSRIDEKLP